ncbi:MAG: hypothetical protein NkDv07_0393 [Candidatus Improbicoccus devescovinae]|nr:MAG: hypothetical protein NkDv07_0393 [Candidatus Improbicoccus devescovinae]
MEKKQLNLLAHMLEAANDADSRQSAIVTDTAYKAILDEAIDTRVLIISAAHATWAKVADVIDKIVFNKVDGQYKDQRQRVTAICEVGMLCWDNLSEEKIREIDSKNLNANIYQLRAYSSKPQLCQAIVTDLCWFLTSVLHKITKNEFKQKRRERPTPPAERRLIKSLLNMYSILRKNLESTHSPPSAQGGKNMVRLKIVPPDGEKPFATIYYGPTNERTREAQSVNKVIYNHVANLMRENSNGLKYEVDLDPYIQRATDWDTLEFVLDDMAKRNPKEIVTLTIKRVCNLIVKFPDESQKKLHMSMNNEGDLKFTDRAAVENCLSNYTAKPGSYEYELQGTNHPLDLSIYSLSLNAKTTKPGEIISIRPLLIQRINLMISESGKMPQVLNLEFDQSTDKFYGPDVRMLWERFVTQIKHVEDSETLVYRLFDDNISKGTDLDLNVDDISDFIGQFMPIDKTPNRSFKMRLEIKHMIPVDIKITGAENKEVHMIYDPSQKGPITNRYHLAGFVTLQTLKKDYEKTAQAGFFVNGHLIPFSLPLEEILADAGLIPTDGKKINKEIKLVKPPVGPAKSSPAPQSKKKVRLTYLTGTSDKTTTIELLPKNQAGYVITKLAPKDWGVDTVVHNCAVGSFAAGHYNAMAPETNPYEHLEDKGCDENQLYILNKKDPRLTGKDIWPSPPDTGDDEDEKEPITVDSDPPPTDPSKILIKFKIEQRNLEGNWVFDKADTIEVLKQKLATKLDVLDPTDIHLLFVGKDLANGQYPQHLRLGGKPIIVYIKDRSTLFLGSGLYD